MPVNARSVIECGPRSVQILNCFVFDRTGLWRNTARTTALSKIQIGTSKGVATCQGKSLEDAPRVRLQSGRGFVRGAQAWRHVRGGAGRRIRRHGGTGLLAAGEGRRRQNQQEHCSFHSFDLVRWWFDLQIGRRQELMRLWPVPSALAFPARIIEAAGTAATTVCVFMIFIHGASPWRSQQCQASGMPARARESLRVFRRKRCHEASGRASCTANLRFAFRFFAREPARRTSQREHGIECRGWHYFHTLQSVEAGMI